MTALRQCLCKGTNEDCTFCGGKGYLRADEQAYEPIRSCPAAGEGGHKFDRLDSGARDDEPHRSFPTGRQRDMNVCPICQVRMRRPAEHLKQHKAEAVSARRRAEMLGHAVPLLAEIGPVQRRKKVVEPAPSILNELAARTPIHESTLGRGPKNQGAAIDVRPVSQKPPKPVAPAKPSSPMVKCSTCGSAVAARNLNRHNRKVHQTGKRGGRLSKGATGPETASATRKRAHAAHKWPERQSTDIFERRKRAPGSFENGRRR